MSEPRANFLRAAPLALGLCLLGASALSADAPTELPRKSTAKSESYPGVTVRYDAIRDAGGHRLRLIVTHPQAGPAKVPAIFVVGWLSCDSVEAPPDTRDATLLVLQSVARLPGFATLRMDKAGVGDSEGDCKASDFAAELAAYRQAFRKLTEYAFVDTSRIFVLGISNGGGFAPLVSGEVPVKGYVVDGGWIKTWYEHMLEIERRRLALAGTPLAALNPLMADVARLYGAYLLDRQSPDEILRRQPSLAPLWEGDREHQYGRPVAYFQQLQELNLMAAWARVSATLLALHGEFDWIMSREDLKIMVELVNRNTPGAAEFVELPSTGHTFEHYATQETAFVGKALPLDSQVAARIGDWFLRHR